MDYCAHIGIEGRLQSQRMAGIGQYTFNLYNQLKDSRRLKVSLFDDEYFMREDTRGIMGMNDKLTNIGGRGARKIAYIIWLNTIFPGILKRQKVDLTHAVNFVPQLTGGTPAVATFHDTGYLRYPHTHHGMYAAVFPSFANAAVYKSRLIIVPSRSSRDEMLFYYPQAKDKVRVVHLAASEEFRIISDSALLKSVVKMYSLPEKFILCVGTLEPRKNLERFIGAFKRYIDRNSSSDLHLVLCGQSWVRHQKFLSGLRESGIAERVVLTGYVKSEELAAIYNLALALGFPSFYEGFGIPAVEAMQSGLPVLASNAFSLPEVLGDAALYFDPFDNEGMTKAIDKIAKDAELRIHLREAGLERARSFSWKKTAEATEEVYLEALNMQ